MTADPQSLSLAGAFPAVGDEQWDAEVLKVMNRGRPDDKRLTVEQARKRLRTRTLDGLTIEPLYTAADLPGELGYPGVMPFTRGAEIRTGEAIAWGVRQLHEDPDVATTRQAVLDDLERGATSVWLRVDPDAVPPSALPLVLADVHLDLAAVRVTSIYDQDAAAAALVDVFKGSGIDLATITGNLGIDGLKHAALHGTPADLSAHRRWVATCVETYPKVKALTVDSVFYDWAGATETQELAYAIATGIEYLRDLEDAAVDLDIAVGQLEFRVSASADQFLTIAKLRALRRLWARVCEESGVSERLRGAHIHAVTSPRMMSTVDPYVNLLRTTVATFGAAAGGADAITVLPFDHAVRLPTPFSRRIARNIQVIAAEESHLGRVSDPAGGSYFVEKLTDDVARAAWAILGAIEAEGGMAAALASGSVTRAIESSKAARDKALATRKIELTGVSTFPLAHEKPLEGTPIPAAPPRNGLVLVRDAEVFEELRAASRAHEAATGSAPAVFLACLGKQRDFGARQGFASNVLLVGGIDFSESHGGTPEEIAGRAREAGAQVAVLCSSAKVYAAEAVPVARALKDAGVRKVYLAGQLSELGEAPPDGLFDGTISLGMNVVDFLTDTFDFLGVAR